MSLYNDGRSRTAEEFVIKTGDLRLSVLSERILRVEKSADGGRMNEYKTHTRWARKICALAAIYGVKP